MGTFTKFANFIGKEVGRKLGKSEIMRGEYQKENNPVAEWEKKMGIYNKRRAGE